MLDPRATYHGAAAKIVGKNAIVVTMVSGKSTSYITANDSVSAVINPKGRSAGKIAEWPLRHDKRAVIVSAGRVYGATKITPQEMESLKSRVQGFA